MDAHTIPNDRPDELVETLALVHPASPQSVETVLNAPLETGDGRSPWVWLRLPNGDLILGMFPQGETYFEVEVDAAYPGSQS